MTVEGASRGGLRPMRWRMALPAEIGWGPQARLEVHGRARFRAMLSSSKDAGSRINTFQSHGSWCSGEMAEAEAPFETAGRAIIMSS
jgi:hypothetical protein